jgi:hypothetical protein
MKTKQLYVIFRATSGCTLQARMLAPGREGEKPCGRG